MNNKVAIVCCSNGQKIEYKKDIMALENILKNIGLVPVFSDYIFEVNSCFSASAKERANDLMNYYRDNEVAAIYDISGGDIANEILSYLDYDAISVSNKMFWGYSDLTTIINAIYAKTGCANVLFQVKNLVWDKTYEQVKSFSQYINMCQSKSNNTMDIVDNYSLFDFKYEFIKGTTMSGVVVGGNIRCFLKLAGTEYFPDTTGKILLLESLGGEVPQMVTYLNQLKHIGVFDRINGILLGTFTTMEKLECKPNMIELVKEYVDRDIPIAKTNEIGHGSNSKAIIIGKNICL